MSKYTISDDGLTVTDNTTGLMWDRATLRNDRMTHAKAMCAATEANTAKHLGYSDWRLPTVTELQSLFDFRTHHPAIDTRAFPGIRPYGYWTDTEYVPYPAIAWIVDFSNGFTLADYKTSSYFVRLVRSGQ